jgi:hypothetical protein
MALLGLRQSLERKVLLVLQEPQALQGQLVLLVLLAPLEQQVQQDLMVQLDRLVLLDR